MKILVDYDKIGKRVVESPGLWVRSYLESLKGPCSGTYPEPEKRIPSPSVEGSTREDNVPNKVGEVKKIAAL